MARLRSAREATTGLKHRQLALGAAVLALALLAAGVPVAGAAKPRVQSVTGVPDRIAVGSTLRVRVRVSLPGSSRSGRRLSLRLFHADARARATRRIPLGSGRRVRPRKAPSLSVRARVPEAALGEGYVLACLSAARAAARCRAGRRLLTVDSGLSSEIIDAARRRGRITATDALRFTVFAVFGDERLPRRFRAERPGMEDATTLMREVSSQWESLPPAVQYELEPFFTPPIYQRVAPGGRRRAEARPAQEGFRSCSGWNVDHTGARSISAMDGKVRIWWAPNTPWEARNLDYATAMAAEIERIWPTYEFLFRREPLDDTNVQCHANGGDGALDIYLFEASRNVKFRAATFGYPPKCDGTPSFMLWVVGDEAGGRPQPFEIAHELFHPFQMAFDYALPCDFYLPYDEATADWALNSLHPESDFPHKRDSFSRYGWRIRDEYPDKGYSLWPFFLYLTERHGGNLIRELYERFETADHPRTALQQTIPGGYDPFWHQFTIDALQRPTVPVKPELRAAHSDGPPATYLSDDDGEVKLNGRRSRTIADRTYLLQLDRSYTEFGFKDRRIRQISISNPIVELDDPDLRVTAILEFAGGVTRVEDWSEKVNADFCRTKPGENLRRLVLIESNSAYEPRIADGLDDPTAIVEDVAQLVKVSAKRCTPEPEEPPVPTRETLVGYRVQYSGKGAREQRTQCSTSTYSQRTTYEWEYPALVDYQSVGGRQTTDTEGDGSPPYTINARTGLNSVTTPRPGISDHFSSGSPSALAVVPAALDHMDPVIIPGSLGDPFVLHLAGSTDDTEENWTNNDCTNTVVYSQDGTMAFDPVRRDGCDPSPEPLFAATCLTERAGRTTYRRVASAANPGSSRSVFSAGPPVPPALAG